MRKDFIKMKRINKKKVLGWCVCSIIAVILVTQLCYWTVALSAKSRIYDSVGEIPYNEVGMVLGTSPLGKSGRTNLFFLNRIKAVEELYKAGKIKFILVSGDNSRKDYSEPDAMKDSLIRRGIPADVIYLDYAGFRTWDSVIRAKKVFGQTRMTVISQKFHNERSVFIGDLFDMEIVGYNAVDSPHKFYMIKSTVREFFARVKIFMDYIVGKQPHFLSEPIEIGEGKPQEMINQPTNSNQGNVTINDTNGLRVYFPNYDKIDLVCEKMPSPKDKAVLMCCEAAFTGKEIFSAQTFQHNYIAGNHVSGGVLHKGYKCRANTGCFAYFADNGTWEFAMDDYKHCLDKAVEHKGAAFGQTMIIFNGSDVHNGRPCKDTSRNQYRALCELDGRLCIIDAKAAMPYKDFVQALLSAGVKHALYLDMGRGWNYSFYRDNAGQTKFIHNHRIKSTTNWITFYK